MKLARLQRQSELDVYASSARDAAEVSGSWYARANAILVNLGLPQPVLTCDSSDAEYHEYKRQVTASLKLISFKSHEASIALSSATLPYQHLQAECPSQILAECRTVTLGWQVQVAVRSWIRLRAGYIELASRDESRSAARILSSHCLCIVSHASCHIRPSRNQGLPQTVSCMLPIVDALKESHTAHHVARLDQRSSTLLRSSLLNIALTRPLARLLMRILTANVQYMVSSSRTTEVQLCMPRKRLGEQ